MAEIFSRAYLILASHDSDVGMQGTRQLLVRWSSHCAVVEVTDHKEVNSATL